MSALADRPEAARAYADEAIASDPLNPWTLWSRAMCELISGDIATAVERCRVAEAQAPDEALRWLANAIGLGFINHRFLSTRDPFLAPLRGDARFVALMDKAREKQRPLVAALE